MPCGGVLPCGLLVVERERRMRSGQLLDRGQRHQRIMHVVSCRDVQRERRVYCVERMLGMSSGGVLPCGLLIVER